MAPDIAWESVAHLPQMSAVITSDAQLFDSLHEQQRLTTRLTDVAPSVLRAVIAVEDRRFFSHNGVDLRSIVRALIVNLRHRRILQGGSTITQQLARTVILKRTDRTFRRKVLEAFVAISLERRFTKLRLLEAYLNAAYFGHGLFGVQVAALTYFHKLASDLSETEAAHIAALLKAPSRYCYCCHPEAGRIRTALALRLMRGADNLAPRGQIRVRRRSIATVLPLTSGYVLGYVRQSLRHFAAYPATPLIITTTVDTGVQLIVEKVCRAARNAGYRGRLACVIQDARSGAIRGLAGGTDWQHQPFDSAANSRLQPGSVLKPFILAAALDQGMGLNDTLVSRPLQVDFGGGRVWTVRNAGGRYSGATTLILAVVHGRGSRADERGHTLRALCRYAPTPAADPRRLRPGVNGRYSSDRYHPGGAKSTCTLRPFAFLRRIYSPNNHALGGFGGRLCAIIRHVVQRSIKGGIVWRTSS